MKQRLRRILLCMAACLCLLFAVSGANAAASDGLEVHFINVGRNDGILIRCGGEDVFIDAGGYYRGEVCAEYMKNLGISKLKYYIGTHAHEDHVGGGPVVIEAFRPETVLQPHDKVKQVIIENIRSSKEKDVVRNANYVNMTVGQKISVGGATLTCLGPINVQNLNPEWGTENENSLILMLTYGEVKILLTGDATYDTMMAVEAANPGSLKADVYKNAHHNQYTREDLFTLIGPDYTIFSTSKGKGPESKYMKLLNKYQSVPLSTGDDHCGTIVLRTDGREIRFDTAQRAESISLSYYELSLFEGKSEKLKPSVKPSKINEILLCSSSNPAVATVDETGRVTGVGAGEAVITVRDGMGASAQCRVTVKPATMTLRKTELSVKQGSRVSASWKIEPSGSKPVITWASMDERIATVDEKGKITGVYPGVTQITATMPSGQVSAITITVEPVKVSSVKISPSSATMTLGESRTVTAKISPKNATWPEVTWSSDDPGIVTIDANGTLRAVGVGKATISATTPEGKSRTARITVKPVYVKKIYLSADITDGLIGGVNGRNQVKLSHQIEPMNATIQGVEWISSNKRIATVDENGVVTGHQEGSVTITCKATDGSGRYARIKLKFGKNELNRTVKAVEGELVVEASRIRYRSSWMEITMTYNNRTGMKQTVPLHGMLTLVTPDGEQIPLMMISEKQRELSHKAVKTYTYKIPLSVHPKLNGLDLNRCSAVIIDPANR